MVDTRTECWESGQGPGSDEKETLTSALNMGTSTGDVWNRHAEEWKEPTKRLACLRSNEEPVGPALPGTYESGGRWAKNAEGEGCRAVRAMRCQLGRFLYVCICASALSAGAAQRPQQNRQATH